MRQATLSRKTQTPIIKRHGDCSVHDMKNHSKLLTMLKGKKRFIMIAVVLAELASLPAAAQIVHRVAFDIRPIVTAVEIPTSEPGVSRFLVASNSGFGVEADDVIGNVDISVHVSGALSGLNRFGDAAQLPGDKSVCSQTTGFTSPIYVADQKTAARKGTAPEQAVVFEFRYAPEARPSFTFKPGKTAVALPTSCFDGIS